MTRRPTTSIVASPVLVGAVTVLVTIVAVLLAYNANSGLPFVPTYHLRAELPSGANLVKGNDVRVGGFRVGLVRDIDTTNVVEHGRRRSVAIVSLELDKTVEPLPLDTRVAVRPRSVLGLKYVELSPGDDERGLRTGATIPLAQAAEAPVEFDDVAATLDPDTRDAARGAIAGYGDALAGRGASLNEALAELRPFVTHLTPVMRALSDPASELDELVAQAGRTAAQLAPVARVQAELFTSLADTFAALGRSPEGLQAAIDRAPDTLDAGIRGFPVERHFVASVADLSRRLRPAAAELPVSLPAVAGAFRAGRPVLPRTVALNERTEDALGALDELAANPSTGLALTNLRDLMDVTRPLLEHVAPYQTVCNYANYFFYGLGGAFSGGVPGGTYFNTLLNSTNRTQDNRPSDFPADRPADIPVELDSQEATDATGEPLTKANTQPYAPAIDADGNADCQVGQWGYLEQLGANGRYAPARSGPRFEDELSGGSSIVIDPDTPGNAGPTFTGVPNLAAVDEQLGWTGGEER